MRNPWLDIPLDDYEAHMSLPRVAQSQLIVQQLEHLIDIHRPTSVAIAGCAGGNGFDCLAGAGVTRIVGIDLNAGYVERARQRHGDSVPGLELYVADIETESRLFDAVDLLYAPLLLEYVDVARAMPTFRRHCRPGGVLAVLLQRPDARLPPISPSPYSGSLHRLEPILRPVLPEILKKHAAPNGFAPHGSTTIRSAGGKWFGLEVFRRDAAA